MADVLCITCGKNFQTQLQLTKHISTVHKLSKISCDECGKSMKNKKHLENHTASHRTVTCKKCKKEIAKNSRSSNSCVEKSFKCEECDFESNQKSNLLSILEGF